MTVEQLTTQPAAEATEKESLNTQDKDFTFGNYAAKALQEDQAGSYSNKHWDTLVLKLNQAGWSAEAVEATLEGVKSFAKTESSRDHVAVFRFYNEILKAGKAKAVEVVSSAIHTGRLFKCSSHEKLQEFVADWIMMFGTVHEVADFIALQKQLPAIAEASSAAKAFKEEYVGFNALRAELAVRTKEQHYDGIRPNAREEEIISDMCGKSGSRSRRGSFSHELSVPKESNPRVSAPKGRRNSVVILPN